MIVLLALLACRHGQDSDPGRESGGETGSETGRDSGGETGAAPERPVGNASLAAAKARASGTEAKAQFGAGLGLGDLDGDGLAEWAVGAPAGHAGAGAVYVFAAGTVGQVADTDADTIVLGAGAEALGTGLVITDDLDADGLGDLAIGAPGWGESAGRAVLFSGLPTGTVAAEEAPVQVVGASAGDQLGVELAPVGDHDGDGFSELGVAAWLADDGARDAGTLFLFHPAMGTNDVADALAALSGAAEQDWAAYGFAGGPDVDGDGFADLLVGADGVDGRGPEAGAAYLLRGPLVGSRSLAGADAVLSGGEPNAYAGHGVALLPDGHVVVGAFGAGEANAGEVGVYASFPASGTLEAAETQLVGEQAEGLFGYALASPGDLDGDGIVDLVVSAPTAGTGPGAIFVIYGPLADPRDRAANLLQLDGESAGDAAGYVLAGAAIGGLPAGADPAADVDGDGWAEFAIGARARDSGAGAAWLWSAR